MLLVIGLYLLISIGVVKSAISHARRNGRNPKRWGWGAAFVMYSLVFWDWVPTIAVHQYYCATEAGFWVYKTPEQWRKENPGVMEALVANNVPIIVRSQDDGSNWSSTEQLNQRINQVGTQQGPVLLHLWRYEAELIDNQTNKVLARSVDFSTSGKVKRADWGWKFWLETRHCPAYKDRAFQFGEILEQFKGVAVGVIRML